MFNLNIVSVDRAEVAKKLTEQLAANFANQSEDSSKSVYERQTYKAMATGLNDSAAGRKLMVAMAKNDNNYAIEEAKLWRAHLGKNGEVDPKIDEALAGLDAKRLEKLGVFLDEATKIAEKTPQPLPTAGTGKALDDIYEKFKIVRPPTPSEQQ